MDSIWLGSREFFATTVLDEKTDPPTVLQDYDVAVLPFSAPIESAPWVPAITYAGERGVWADGQSTGVYRIFARVGSGTPNEQLIVLLHTFNVRSR